MSYSDEAGDRVVLMCLVQGTLLFRPPLLDINGTIISQGGKTLNIVTVAGGSIFGVGMRQGFASRKHLRTKVTPDFHLTYSKNGGNLGSESK